MTVWEKLGVYTWLGVPDCEGELELLVEAVRVALGVRDAEAVADPLGLGAWLGVGELLLV